VVWNGTIDERYNKLKSAWNKDYENNDDEQDPSTCDKARIQTVSQCNDGNSTNIRNDEKYDRKRRHTNSKDESSSLDRNYKIKKIETKITHNILVVPLIELGTIEVYYDLDGVKYIWTWKTKDKFSSKIEPSS